MGFDPSMPQEEKIAFYQDRARHYIASVNGKDLEAILELFADDAVVEDPVFERQFSGKDALRQFYAGVITRARLEIVGPVRGTFGNIVASPVKAYLAGFEIDVITLTTFDDEGRISHYAAYWGPTDKKQV